MKLNTVTTKVDNSTLFLTDDDLKAAIRAHFNVEVPKGGVQLLVTPGGLQLKWSSCTIEGKENP